MGSQGQHAGCLEADNLTLRDIHGGTGAGIAPGVRGLGVAGQLTQAQQAYFARGAQLVGDDPHGRADDGIRICRWFFDGYRNSLDEFVVCHGVLRFEIVKERGFKEDSIHLLEQFVPRYFELDRVDNGLRLVAHNDLAPDQRVKLLLPARDSNTAKLHVVLANVRATHAKIGDMAVGGNAAG